MQQRQILRQSPGKTTHGARRRQLQRTPHDQLSDARVVTRQMTIIEIIIADLRRLSNGGRRARLCVLVNAVCAGDQWTCEMTRAVISTANAVLQHLTHVTRD